MAFACRKIACPGQARADSPTDRCRRRQNADAWPGRSRARPDSDSRSGANARCTRRSACRLAVSGEPGELARRGPIRGSNGGFAKRTCAEHGAVGASLLPPGTGARRLGRGRAGGREYYRKALYLEPDHCETLRQMALLLEKNGTARSPRAALRAARRPKESGLNPELWTR